MGLEEKYDTIKSLTEKIDKIIGDNKNNIKLYQPKIEDLRVKFDAKKQECAEQIKKSGKYNSEYKLLSEQYNIFLLEQYNLSRLVIDTKVREISMYIKRLEMFKQHLISRKAKPVDIKNSFYGFNDAVQKELIDKYDTRIQIIKQRKILSDRFEKYLELLKVNYPSEYQEKKSHSMSKEDLLNLLERKDLLKEEQMITKCELGKRFDVLSEQTILSMELTNPDVMVVAQKLYPNLKDKLLELNESRNNTRKQAM